MPIGAKIFMAYVVISIMAGLSLMIVSAARGFDQPVLNVLINWLYLPPMAIVIAAFLGACLYAIWNL